MSYHFEKSGDLVIDGWEKGIQPSPHLGIANLQSVNVSTETGEVMCNFSRIRQSQTIGSGTLTTTAGSSSFQIGSHTGTFLVGQWITINTSTITELVVGTKYYILSSINPAVFLLSTGYSNNITDEITSTAGGTCTYTISYVIGTALSSATEIYTANDTTTQFRYYILDSNGLIWVSDSYTGSVSSVTLPKWYLPNTTAVGGASGIAVLNGWLFAFNNKIQAKPTVSLDSGFVNFSGGTTMTIDSSNPHFAFVGHQGKLYYTDGNYIGSIFPNTSLLSGVVNIQSYAKYTTSTTTGTISTLIGGSIPTVNTAGTAARIPCYFFATGAGAQPATALTTGTTYYIDYTVGNSAAGTFKVYAALTGGSALDITTGQVGTQYFNTFYPISGSGGGLDSMTFTPQRLNLPFYETAQCIAEISNQILIGCSSNVVYPWNQIDPTPGDLIFLPESNVSSIVTVNNMGYIFAGFKGNIYISNGSAASLILTIPDYCAGIAGSPSTYIEPYFVWGGTMYLRGRVYFSVLDQTASKTGNCGGIWSFTPTQNMFFGEDVGISLRMDNQASYGTYNGYSTVLLPSQNQKAISPQYWNAWQSTASGTTFGIDFTNTTTFNPAIIETDLIPIGTMLNKATQKQIEFKLAAPLTVGESVAISFRQNSTDAFTVCTGLVSEGTNIISGYFPANFEKGQWLQLQVTLTPMTDSTSSFVRLKEIRIR